MQQRFEYYWQTDCNKLYDISRNTHGRRMEDSILSKSISATKKTKMIVINGIDQAELDDFIDFICTT